MAGKVCLNCDKEQTKKFASICAFCGHSLNETADKVVNSQGQAKSGDRFDLNKKLLETMVTLASIDGKIGENELETLINFTCQLGGVFTGFDTRPLFEALISEVQSLDENSKFNRLKENGVLFQRAFSAEFNRSFISDFEKMISADGKITANEAISIKILKEAMFDAPIQKVAENRIEDEETELFVAKVIETAVVIASSDGEIQDKEQYIIARIAAGYNRIVIMDPEKMKCMLSVAIVKVNTMSREQKINLLVENGEFFNKNYSVKFRKNLVKIFNAVIVADGVVDENELFGLNILESTMFDAPIQKVADSGIENERNASDKDNWSEIFISKIFETLFLIASSDGEMQDEEVEIISNLVVAYNQDLIKDIEKTHCIMTAAINKIKVMEEEQRFDLLLENGDFFNKKSSVALNTVIFEIVGKIITADGVVDNNEVLYFKALRRKMFPEAT